MEVLIEKYVQQVSDGDHYEGYIKIAEIKLNYDLRLAVPIDQLDNLEPTESVDEIRRLFQFTIKKDKTNIELTDEEFKLFFQLIVPFVLDFYNNPQTRNNNQGLMGKVLRNEGPMAAFGISASIGITRVGLCSLSPQFCEILNASKFGCTLIA